ncbi:MAG: Clp protease ClpP [Alistipes sp.]|nr:Clp protease ClpP [Alistipes sp.]
MKTKIEITNDVSVCTIDIEGVIGVPEESQFSKSSQSIATYEKFSEKLAQIRAIEAKEVIVNIRSTGGDVNDALLIYESLASLDAKITTRCYGYTASAATIIAQAASEGCREIAPSALYLIHMSSSSVEGNSTDLAERIALLEKSDEQIATLYALRSGLPKEGFVALMSENGGRGRWLSPEEAIEAGLADAVTGTDERSEKRGIIEKIKGWLNLPIEDKAEPSLPRDINVLHDAASFQSSISAIAFRNGQRSVSSTKTTLKEDPSLEGVSATQNALAYAEDVLKFKGR